MLFLPYEKIVYYSPLSPEEISKLLDRNVEPRDFVNSLFSWSRSDTSADFEGTLEDSSFTIRRVIRYRNSFLPIINGTVESVTTGSRITVRMRISYPVMVFCFVWLTGVISALISSLKGGMSESALHPAAMLAFFGALVLGSFKYESYKARKLLAILFQTQHLSVQVRL